VASDDADYPVVVGPDGIKLRTERMVPDELYHCLYENKVFLFFKDEQGMLNCYEVEDQAVVSEISSDPSRLEEILRKYANQESEKQS
jgi:hypothetical protein